MSEAFDPYHRWLGIQPKDQPPHHYRLLGIDLFEDDHEVIRDATERQMAHVRKYHKRFLTNSRLPRHAFSTARKRLHTMPRSRRNWVRLALLQSSSKVRHFHYQHLHHYRLRRLLKNTYCLPWMWRARQKLSTFLEWKVLGDIIKICRFILVWESLQFSEAS